jgi:hypothetical protein
LLLWAGKRLNLRAGSVDWAYNGAMPNKSFVIGALEGNHVAIKIFGYEHPQAAEHSEANWLSAELNVWAGVWGGKVRDASLTTSEVRDFRLQVEELAAGKRDEAHLEPIEPHLVLKLASEGDGRVEVSGVAFDQPQGVNAIAFNWIMEHKLLKVLARQLHEVEDEYPPR